LIKSLENAARYVIAHKFSFLGGGVAMFDRYEEAIGRTGVEEKERGT